MKSLRRAQPFGSALRFQESDGSGFRVPVDSTGVQNRELHRSPGVGQGKRAAPLLLIAGAMVMFIGLSPEASGQQPSQEPSLAEAARKARQQKSTAPKATRVFTNDNLPSRPGAVSPSGTPSATSAGGEAGEASAARGPVSAADEKERTEAEAELEKAKAGLDVLKKDLELLTREFNLQRQVLYGKPSYADDRAGKTALDALEAQKTQKQQEVQQAEEKVKSLEEKLKALEEKLGPRKVSDRDALLQKLRPLRDELARVESELRRIRSEATAQGMTAYPPTVGGGFTADMIAQLEKRRSDLQRQISDLEDDARRAGFRP